MQSLLDILLTRLPATAAISLPAVRPVDVGKANQVFTAGGGAMPELPLMPSGRQPLCTRRQPENRAHSH